MTDNERIFGDRRRSGMIHNLLGAVLFVALVTAIVMLAIREIRPSRPPVTLYTADMSATVARPGQHVWVQVDRTRHRYCPGRAHQFWLSTNGDVVQAGIEPTSPSSELGRRITRFRKTVPDLPPGEWCYAPRLQYDCEDDRYMIEQPAACLTVLPPAE